MIIIVGYDDHKPWWCCTSQLPGLHTCWFVKKSTFKILRRKGDKNADTLGKGYTKIASSLSCLAKSVRDSKKRSWKGQQKKAKQQKIIVCCMELVLTSIFFVHWFFLFVWRTRCSLGLQFEYLLFIFFA